MESTQDPILLIEQAYLEKKAKNSRYSLTAFARDLGTSAAQLSRILNRSRNLTHRQAAKIAVALHLSRAESNAFIQQAIRLAPKNAKVSQQLRIAAKEDASSLSITNYPVDRFKSISSWYDTAILSIVYLEDFKPNHSWIAGKLGISSLEAKDALKRLLSLELLEPCSRRGYKATHSCMSIKTKHSEPEMRKFHIDLIEKSKTELQKISDHDFALRLINGITFPCDPAFIPELKGLIHDFQFKILSLIKKQKHKEVYRLNCQLFPLTKTKGKK